MSSLICSVGLLLTACGKWAWNFINSSFSSALFGAFAGAWAAQKIADRSSLSAEQLKQIRSANAATATALAMVNTFIAVKRQHVARMAETYRTQRLALENYQERVRVGRAGPREVFHFDADLQTLLPINTPEAELKELLYEKVSVPAPVLTLFALLTAAISALNGCIEGRNRVIEEIRAAQLRGEKIDNIYFGLMNNAAQVDARYPDFVQAIAEHTDDCLIFSYALTEQLCELTRASAIKLSKRRRPVLALPNLQDAIDTGLVPWSDNYRDIFARLHIEVSHPAAEVEQRRLA